jgi:hypothetical protein
MTEALSQSQMDFKIVPFDGQNDLEGCSPPENDPNPGYKICYRPYLFCLAGFGLGALGALATGNPEHVVNAGTFWMVPTSAASYLLGALGFGD